MFALWNYCPLSILGGLMGTPKTAMAWGCPFWSSCCYCLLEQCPCQAFGRWVLLRILTLSTPWLPESLHCHGRTPEKTVGGEREENGFTQYILAQLFKIRLTACQNGIEVTKRRLLWHISGKCPDGDWQLVI